MNNLILVFGLPGVGKTTLIKKSLKILKKNDYVRVSGGSLISENITEEERDSLRKLGETEILFNQNLLLQGYSNFKLKNSKVRIIFDGHCIIKNGNKIVEVPIDIIKKLSPQKIIFLDEEPNIIINRRVNDDQRPDREEETLEQLEELRVLQKSICKEYGNALNISVSILKSASIEEFLQQVMY